MISHEIGCASGSRLHGVVMPSSKIAPGGCEDAVRLAGAESAESVAMMDVDAAALTSLEHGSVMLLIRFGIIKYGRRSSCQRMQRRASGGDALPGDAVTPDLWKEGERERGTIYTFAGAG